MPVKILFVCSGNTCRSPMAQALARRLLADSPGARAGVVEVSSAGVMAGLGGPSANAIAAMAELGIDISGHRAKNLSLEDVLSADLVLTMTGHHKEAVLASAPGAGGKVFTLGEYAGEDMNVEDPYLRPLDVYRRCARTLEYLVSRSLKRFFDSTP